MLKKIFNIILYIFAAIGLFLTLGYFAVKFGLTNTKGIIDNQRETFLDGRVKAETNIEVKSWQESEEWQTLKTAILKDVEPIKKAAKESDVSPRIIVSSLVVEQLRLFYSEREVYKQIFSPLKILGNQSQFSWGVMGIKPETAKDIEKNLKDKNSDFYPGVKYEALLDFSTENSDQERFERIVNENNRYYSYLYSALYFREIESQWKKNNFDITNRPEILATLFNIGFSGSKPNRDPKSGGASIDIGNTKYSFGSLAKEFYDSNEFLDVFPK